MKFKVFILIILLFTAFIQAGSILSSEDLGIPACVINGRSMGMGGVSMAVPDIYDLPRANPAGLHMIELSRFTIQYMYESNNYQTDQGSERSPRSNFDGFMFGIPIASQGALAFSLAPYSRVNYKTSFPNQVNNETFTQIISGSGGLNTLNFSGSLKLLDQLAIGVTGHYYFGRIEKNWLIDFSESQYFTTKDTYATQVYGIGATLGLQYEPISNIMIGATWTPQAALDSKTFFDYKSMDDASLVTYLHHRDTLKSKIHLPASMKFGLGWHINSKWLVGSDIRYSNWKNFKINSILSDKTQNLFKYALGFEYTPSRDPYAPIFKKSVYRAGFSFGPYYLKDANDKTINEWNLTTGIGIPIWNNSSRANIAIAYGQRGSLNSNGLSEKLFRIILSLDAGEKWFVRRR